MKNPTYQPAIFSATLGLSHPWQIMALTFAKDEKRLDIIVDFAHGSTFRCPACGAEEIPCATEAEIWYHSNFFSYETYLHAHVPRIECSCGRNMVQRPWSRAGSQFELLPSRS